MTWKPIEGYEELYQVSDTGLVKSLNFSFKMSNGHTKTINEQLKKSQINHRGYSRVQLTKEGKKRIFSVHRLVMFAFGPEGYFNGAEVNHKNGIKNDNRIDNLEWCTKAENEIHASKTGLKPSGQKHHFALLSTIHVQVIREALEKGFKGNEIAKYFKVSPSTISSIKVGRNWACA